MNTEIEGNKLIAEFMGDYTKDAKVSFNLSCVPEQFKYHSSWDWLKPVIDQCIRTVGVKTIDECSDEEWKVSTNITRMYIGVPIEWAWNYVVEFIKWHNKNNNHGNNI